MTISTGESAQTPTHSDLIAEYHALSSRRKALDRESRELEAREKAIQYELSKAWATLKVPSGFHLARKVKTVPNVTDWPAFLTWARENDALDCLQKRLTESAVMARLDSGAVPGVETTEKTSISVETYAGEGTKVDK